MTAERIGYDEIEAAFRKTVDWLLAHRIEVDAQKWGWSHHSNGKCPITWGGTVDAVIALSIINTDDESEVVRKGLNWLKDSFDGRGWSPYELDFPGIESTAWGLMALTVTNDPTYSELKNKAKAFLVNNVNPDNGWSSVKGEESRVYATAITLRSLLKAGVSNKDPIIQKGVNWLLESQSKLDGGWGFTKAADSNIAMTAHALIALIDARINMSRQALDSAKEFILGTQNSNGSWDNVWETRDLTSAGKTRKRKGNRSIWDTHHFSSAWCVMALLRLNIPVSAESIQKAVRYLLDDINAGWKLTKDPDVFTWHVFNAIYAVATYRESATSVPSLLSIYGELRDLKRLDLTENKSFLKRVEDLDKDIQDMKRYHIYFTMLCLLSIISVVAFAIYISGLNIIIFDFFARNIDAVIVTIIGVLIPVILESVRRSKKKKASEREK